MKRFLAALLLTVAAGTASAACSTERMQQVLNEAEKLMTVMRHLDAAAELAMIKKQDTRALKIGAEITKLDAQVGTLLRECEKPTDASVIARNILATIK